MALKGSTRWFKHLKEQKAKQEFQARLAESALIFKVLASLIEEDMDVSDREKLSKETYKDPSWAYVQADKNGENRAYTKILNLIKEFT